MNVYFPQFFPLLNVCNVLWVCYAVHMINIYEHECKVLIKLHRARVAVLLINFCIILIRRSHDPYFINDIITTCHFTYRVHGKLWCTNINSWQTRCRRYDGTNSRSTSHVLSHNKLFVLVTQQSSSSSRTSFHFLSSYLLPFN